LRGHQSIGLFVTNLDFPSGATLCNHVIIPVRELFSDLLSEQQSVAMALFFIVAEPFQESFVFCSISIVFDLNGRILNAP